MKLLVLPQDDSYVCMDIRDDPAKSKESEVFIHQLL